jgi:cytoskeletal protein CcmA (bactofilin family)
MTTVIGRDAFVRGKLRGEGDVVVAGRVEGEITVEGDVTLEASALVMAPITGTRVVIRGAVRGDVSASEVLELGKNARIVGNLKAPRIAIEEGALVRGQVTTGGAPVRANTSSVAQRARVAPPAVAPRHAQAAPPPAAKPVRTPILAAPSKPLSREMPRLAEKALAIKMPVAVKAAPGAVKKSSGKAPPMVVPVLRKGTKAKVRR